MAHPVARGAASPQAQAPGQKERRRVLVLGGGLGGLAAARELRRHFTVTLVDEKEYFEFASGILRAFVDPSTWDSLTFSYHGVLEGRLGVRFFWGEVTQLDSHKRAAKFKPMFKDSEDLIFFDYCVVAVGCSYPGTTAGGPGSTPWLPALHHSRFAENAQPRLDERFLEGRRRRVLEVHQTLCRLNRRSANVLIVGAGFIGVQWATELQFFFPRLNITLIDWLQRCLEPLPQDAADYCEAYMRRKEIKTHYRVKYDPENEKFWALIGLTERPQATYTFAGVRHSNNFMPENTLSDRGPGGGGWILINRQLQVVTRAQEAWCNGSAFAIGDCTLGGVHNREVNKWEAPPLPKTGFPAEHQALRVVRNISALDQRRHGGRRGCCLPRCMKDTWYPWGASIYAISLGPRDGCVVSGVGDREGTGRLSSKGLLAVVQKELIASTKLAQCRGDHRIARAIWCLLHHWPANLRGAGPLCCCCC